MHIYLSLTLAVTVVAHASSASAQGMPEPYRFLSTPAVSGTDSLARTVAGDMGVIIRKATRYCVPPRRCLKGVDLAVLGLTTTGQAVPVGSPFGFEVKVVNRGNAASTEVGMSIEKAYNGSWTGVLGRFTVPALSPGDTVTIRNRVVVAHKSDNNLGELRVVLDPEQTLTDANQVNNTLVVTPYRRWAPQIVLETVDFAPEQSFRKPIPIRIVLFNNSRVATTPATELNIANDLIGANPGGGRWFTRVPVPSLAPGQRVEMKLLLRDGTFAVDGPFKDSPWYLKFTIDPNEVFEWTERPRGAEYKFVVNR